MPDREPLKPDSVFSVDTPEESSGFLLWQTTITWQRLIKKELEPYAISHSQFVIMANLLWFDEQKEALTQVSIARNTKLDIMTVSKALKKLALDGYVKRTESEKDPRAKWVKLTTLGKKLISKLIPIVESIDAKYFSVLSKNEQKILNQIFVKIIKENES